MSNASIKQVDYIKKLAEELGAPDGREWLLDLIPSAPGSARPERYLDRDIASDIIDILETTKKDGDDIASATAWINDDITIEG